METIVYLFLSKVSTNSGKSLTANISCSREAIIASRSRSCDRCTVVSSQLSGILSPKKTVVSRLCCVCPVDHFDKSFGADGFWSGHVLYKRQLFGRCGLSLLHREFAWQGRHQTIVLMTVRRCWNQ